MSARLPAGQPIAGRLDAAQRERYLDSLAHGSVDLLVVGGGVTGCGVALDAVTRGLTVALVERCDLASGTSRWSSKLVHGGLRYLAQGDVRLARESARERAVLMGRTAPYLVRTLPMVVPAVATLPRSRAALVNVGHHAAHLLGSGPSRLPRPRRLDPVTTRALLPGLRSEGLRGGYVNYDGQLEDDARLVVGLARTAAAHGAQVVTYCRAERIDGSGADVVADGQALRICARAVVNATGVWAGDLDPAVRLRPSKGAHLVLPASAFGHPTASMTVAVPSESNRYVFALPHADGLVHLGLTDDPLDGPTPDEPAVTDADADFLLATISPHLTRPVTRADVIGSYAGLRPLLTGGGVDPGGRTADLSRRHAVTRADSGAWSVVGGKLTTYRLMAQDAVDAVVRGGGPAVEPCRTTDLPLLGAARSPARQAVPARLVRRYGAEAGAVAALADARPELLRPVADGVPVLAVELVWGVTQEGARTVEDLLARRTRLSLVPAWAEAARPAAERALAV